MALGAVRTHGCSCPARTCPVAAVRRLLALPEGPAGGDGPLWPTDAGGFPSKVAVVRTLRGLAAASGHTPGIRTTGHSGRCTGAQAMAAAGVSEWRIQVFGRWGSSAVLRYIREAQLALSANLAREVSEGAECVLAASAAAAASCSLGRVRRQLRAQLPAPGAQDLTQAAVRAMIQEAVETPSLRTGPGAESGPPQPAALAASAAEAAVPPEALGRQALYVLNVEKEPGCWDISQPVGMRALCGWRWGRTTGATGADA